MRKVLLLLTVAAISITTNSCEKSDSKTDATYGCESSFTRKQVTNMPGKLAYYAETGWLLKIDFTTDNEYYPCRVCNVSDAQFTTLTAGMSENVEYDVTVSGKIKDMTENQGTQPIGGSYPKQYYITVEGIAD